MKWSIGDVFLFRTQDRYLGVLKEKIIIGKIIDIVPQEYNHGYKYIYKSSLECSSFTRFKLNITSDYGIFWVNSPMDISSTKLNKKEAQDMINYLKAKNL